MLSLVLCYDGVFKKGKFMKQGFTHESQAAETVSWYTPPSIFELLNIEFDLDVCAPQGGVPWIPAKDYFALPTDGLSQPWVGKVWCNPPYSTIAIKLSIIKITN